MSEDDFLRYLLAHNAAAAHVESQRVLDHTGIVATASESWLVLRIA